MAQYYPPQYSYPPQQQYPPQQYPPQQQYPTQYPPQPSWQPGPPHEGGFHHHDSSEFVRDNSALAPLSGQPGAEGERGLGATLIGGAGGAFLGHKLEHSALGTLGGLALGAIAANAFEHHEKKKKEERREMHEYDDGYRAGERRGSRSRDIDDGRSEAYSYGRRGSRARDFDDERSEVYRDRRYSQDRGYGEESEYDQPPPRQHRHHHRREYDDAASYTDDYRSEVSGYGDSRREYRERDYDRY